MTLTVPPAAVMAASAEAASAAALAVPFFVCFAITSRR